MCSSDMLLCNGAYRQRNTVGLRGGEIRYFANSKLWKFGIYEILCRIQILEIVTMQLAIKDHNLMAEYQDNGNFIGFM